MSEPTAVHVLIFPYPAQGHMIPLLDFTHHLLARGGLTATVLVTPKNLPRLSPLLSANPDSVTPLVLPFPAHPNIPAGVENTVDLHPTGFLDMMYALSGLRDPIADWFLTHPAPPVAIVSDMFLGWTHRLADDLGVRSYSFFPSGAFAMSFIYNLWRRSPERVNPDDPNEMVGFPEIPKSPVYPWWQLSPLFQGYVKGNPKCEFIKASILGTHEKCYGLVFNTFDALERVYTEYLSRKLGHNRVWSIGPVLPPDDGGRSNRGGPSSIHPNKVQSWLDTCQDHSVVYVCFGSQAVLTNKQMKELTTGLNKSGVKFILSAKGATVGHDDETYGNVPAGFEERVAGRGLLIKGWAPQVLILRHRAVAAFLTHCGWNSVLESVIAGVPMLAWPMGADQFLNATLLVDQMDVAVRVCEGDEAVLESEDLVKLLGEVTGKGEWKERRQRAAELSKAVADAVREGGSSSRDLDALARQLAGNCVGTD